MAPPYPNRLRELRGRRFTQEELAEKVGVDTSTYRGWEEGLHRPRPSNVRALCKVLGVREEQLGYDTRPEAGASPAGTEVLKVAIAVVTNDTRVLLVCRRDDTGALAWQFPAGVVKPGANPAIVAVRETLAETGVHCAVRSPLGSRVHPVTQVLCEYFLCDYLSGAIENLDVVENVGVAWAERARLADFIPVDRIYPPILEALEIDEA